MTETVIKKKTGEAAFFTEQAFLNIEDAYADRNPLAKAKATVSDIKINNIKYRLEKNETENKHSNPIDNAPSHNVTNS